MLEPFPQSTLINLDAPIAYMSSYLYFTYCLILPLTLTKLACTAYREGDMYKYLVQETKEIIYINTQENNNRTALINLQLTLFLESTATGGDCWESWSFHFVEKLVCYLKGQKRTQLALEKSKPHHSQKKKIIFSIFLCVCVSDLHNGPLHAKSQRVLQCSPHRCWTWSQLEPHRVPDALLCAHSVQSVHTLLLLYL